MIQKFSVILVILTLLSCASIQQSLWGPDYGPHVEVIVSKYENLQAWSPSKDGNKYFYATEGSPIYLFFPDSGNYYTLRDCVPRDYRWLDNQTLYCVEQRFIIWLTNRNEPLEILPTIITDTAKLETAQRIYTVTNQSVVISQESGNPPEYYLFENLPSRQQLLAKYRAKLAPPHPGIDSLHHSSPERRYAPNGAYYSKVQNYTISIHDAQTDSKLVEFVGSYPIYTSYWAGDSSGVYFTMNKLLQMGAVFPDYTIELLKLNTP